MTHSVLGGEAFSILKSTTRATLYSVYLYYPKTTYKHCYSLQEALYYCLQYEHCTLEDTLKLIKLKNELNEKEEYTTTDKEE